MKQVHPLTKQLDGCTVLFTQRQLLDVLQGLCA